MQHCFDQGDGLEGVELDRAGWTTGNMYALRRRLGHYLSCCRAAVGKASQYISVSTDKSRVHALGLQNTMVCLANNVSFWAPPQAIVVHSGAGEGGGVTRPAPAAEFLFPAPCDRYQYRFFRGFFDIRVTRRQTNVRTPRVFRYG